MRDDSRATFTSPRLRVRGPLGDSESAERPRPSPRPSPRKSGEREQKTRGPLVAIGPLIPILAPMSVTAAAQALVRDLFVLNPIRRDCVHMLPPASCCVVRLWALFATRSPVCSVSATDSKCIQTALDYSDGGGIRAAPGRRDKRRGAYRPFWPVPNRPPEESMIIKQALCVG